MSETWDEANCRTTDPEVWFDPTTFTLAKQICNECPIRVKCLQFALDGQDFTYGVWGGLTPDERKQLIGRKK